MRYIVFPIVFIVGGFACLAGLFAFLIGLSYLWHIALGLGPQTAMFAAAGTIIAIMLGAMGIAEARNP